MKLPRLSSTLFIAARRVDDIEALYARWHCAPDFESRS
jgi:hypothetical protein